MEVTIRNCRCFLLSLLLILSANSSAQKVAMVTTQWDPFFSESLLEGGVVTEIAKVAFATQGHQASVDWYPWIRALKLVEYGSADVVMGAYYSKERAQNYLYSDPIFSIDVGLITRKEVGLSRYENLQSLKPYTIGVMRGWVYTDEFDKADFLNKHVVINQISAVRMLFAKRVDMVAASIPVFLHEMSLLKNHQGIETVVLKPILASRKLYLMFGRVNENGEKLLKDFNAGLAKIRADGTFDKILAKHGF